jgi:hypothetical protein
MAGAKAHTEADDEAESSEHDSGRSDRQLQFATDHELGQKNEEDAGCRTDERSHNASADLGSHGTPSYQGGSPERVPGGQASHQQSSATTAMTPNPGPAGKQLTLLSQPTGDPDKKVHADVHRIGWVRPFRRGTALAATRRFGRGPSACWRPWRWAGRRPRHDRSRQ